MHPQVLISGLFLLLPAALDSFPEVHGVVGHPVTLPCAYAVSHGISSMCWGQGECGDSCGQTLMWTDGYRIYYWTSNCYQLKGQLLEGDESLTIEIATESDSCLYCCRVEMKGPNGVQRMTISLKVQPVYTITVTSSRLCWKNHIKVAPTMHPLKISTEGLYIGISVSNVVLLLSPSDPCGPVVFYKYKNKAFEITMEAKDSVYTIEDSFHPRINSQLPSKMTSFQDCR
ncbi:Gm12169 [Phodopus roborovskii]|uniref:Gm12169 protein n=1 Tax=Phodopus roborovskii TaxID=109678 RepID=A0AAU9Z3Q1_PHORO|nr:Gm12169 [Phodopus roborovskii]